MDEMITCLTCEKSKKSEEFTPSLNISDEKTIGRICNFCLEQSGTSTLGNNEEKLQSSVNRCVKCNECQQYHPSYNFGSHPFSKNGLHSLCYKCREEKRRSLPINSYLNQYLHHLRSEASINNIPISLTLTDLITMNYHQHGKCYQTDVTMTTYRNNQLSGSPRNLEVIMINSQKGYLPDNICLVTSTIKFLDCMTSDELDKIKLMF